MSLGIKILIYLYFLSGLGSVQPLTSLVCPFKDEYSFKTDENITETRFFLRDAMLQFGKARDFPVNPHVITFLITGSKVDLQQYMEGADEEALECEVSRYSSAGSQTRWPTHGAQEYDRWFTCSLKHAHLFTATAFLRHTPTAPPAVQEDSLSKLDVRDTDTLIMTVAMVLQTRSPSLIVGLQSDPKLHCQFAVDHKGADASMEWQFRRRGDRTAVFQHSSRSGRTQGRGVSLGNLARGDLSLSLPPVQVTAEGTYVCSLAVPPLSASLDVTLHITESPRVSLNVEPTLSLKELAEQKVICEAHGYYPLDVEIDWYQEPPGVSGQRVGAVPPRRLQNVLLSSHKNNRDGTYSLSAFFYLQASLADSGSRFTCRVLHSSLRVPVRKTFTLMVHELTSWTFILTVGFVFVLLASILMVSLHYLYKARREAARRKWH